MLIINEIQKTGDRVAVITETYSESNVNAAKSRYHQLLAIAATSEVPEHSVVLISEEGNWMFHEKYVHETSEEE